MKTCYIYLFILLLLLLKTPLRGQGIVFSDYRFIMNENQIYTLQVCNPTDVPRAYQLLLQEMQMDGNGHISSLPDSVPFAQSLKKQIRFFPKRISLAPKECQAVQIQLKNTSQLPKGEFRSYLFFLPLTDAEKKSEADVKPNAVVPAIVMRVGAAIPLIFRNDAHLDAVSINSVQLKKENNKKLLTFKIHREGSQSTYGIIRVFSLLNGKQVLVKELPGHAVLPEINDRQIFAELEFNQLDTDSSGKTPFIIQYVNQEKDSKKEVLAEWTGAF